MDHHNFPNPMAHHLVQVQTLMEHGSTARATAQTGHNDAWLRSGDNGDITWYTLWLCQNSYWKWPFIVDFPMKNGDFP